MDVSFFIPVPKRLPRFKKTHLRNSAISNFLVSKSSNEFCSAVTVVKLFCLPLIELMKFQRLCSVSRDSKQCLECSVFLTFIRFDRDCCFLLN